MRTSLPKLKEILLATIALAFALTLTLGLTACGQQTGASEEGASSGRLNETKLFEDTAAQEGEGPATVEALVFESSGSTIYGQIMVPDASYVESRPWSSCSMGLLGLHAWTMLCRHSAAPVR